MANWLIEEGIGEHRAIRLDGAEIAEARVEWPGALTPGLIEDAILISREGGSARGTARFANGEMALVDRLPRDASEGAALRLTITRAALNEKRRTKLAHARPTSDDTRPAPGLAERLRSAGHDARVVHRFPACDWDELIGEALDGEVEFTGGTLLFSATPAMLLIDIDGIANPRDLALAAIPALAAALRRFDCGGSIGIDFPTLSAKADRRLVDEALSAQLAGWPHERTAMNGFGFVQLVARMEGPSLLHRAAHSRAALAARLLLRRAEQLDGPGQLELRAHPAVLAQIDDSQRAELRRRTGKEPTIRATPELALEAPHAQLVQS